MIVMVLSILNSVRNAYVVHHSTLLSNLYGNISEVRDTKNHVQVQRNSCEDLAQDSLTRERTPTHYIFNE
jgi:hypothetical protein